MQNSIPYNLEAEVAVLGGLLNDPEKIYEIREILYPECFYDKKHRIIYDAILSLVQNNKAIDLLTTVDELKNNNKLIEAGDVEYLTKLSESVSIATNIYSYAQIVYDKSLIRETINEAKQIIDKAQSVDNADDVIEFAGTRMVALSKLMRSTDFLNWDEVLDQSLTKLHELRENNTKLTGLDTGYKILNDKTNGFHGGELIVIAARPSMGKTAFALNLMHNIATSVQNKEPHIAFFSLEMPVDQIINRLLAIQSLIPMSKIKNGNLDDDDMKMIIPSYKILKELHMHIDETPGVKINELKTKARKLKTENKLDAIFVDYLQLITTNQAHLGRTAEVSLISRELKALAKELDVPVIALSQLSRKSEERASRKPQMSDIRESGAIEQDADIIMMLYRPDYYSSADDGIMQSRVGEAQVLLEKNRNGATGELEFTFLAETNKFVPYEDKVEF